MKSSELIKQLQELDPEGVIEVCVNNVDIYFLDVEGAYYNGSLQVLTRDESKKPYYNITGAKYVRHGSKIVLHPMSIRDVLWDNPDTAVIDYSECSDASRSMYEDSDNKTRQASRDCEKRVEMDFFFAWAKKKAVLLSDDLEDLRDECDRFYEENLSPNDPLKVLPPKPDKDGNMWNASQNDRRESQWDDTIEVRWTGYWELHKKETV